MTASQNQKLRGRPRKSAGEDLPAEHRRSQIRKAQAAFRARKHDAELAKDAHLRKLEDTVADMSNVFLKLSDYLVSSELCRKDARALSKLTAATRQILALTKLENDTIVTPSPSDDQNAARGIEVLGEDPLRAEEVTLVDHAMPGATQLAITEMDNLTTAVLPAIYSPATIWPNQIENAFGNGWLGRAPAFVDYPNHISMRAAEPLDWHSIGFRLLQSTLKFAYWSLVDPASVAANVADDLFRYALMFHTKEELIFNLRWFLGPGIEKTRHLMHITYKPPPPSARTDIKTEEPDYPVLHPFVDTAAVQNAGSESFDADSELTSYFMGAEALEEYLKEKGATFLDHETIELSLNTSAAFHDGDLRDHGQTYSGTLNLNPGLDQANSYATQAYASSTRPFSHMLDVFGLDALFSGQSTKQVEDQRSMTIPTSKPAPPMQRCGDLDIIAGLLTKLSAGLLSLDVIFGTSGNNDEITNDKCIIEDDLGKLVISIHFRV